ncbi:hypothetical protein acdb102_35640 [Acidothermaceae bacterium B102]|nr:hypothetical protein acdb102_35640 [Acidothermaceae bacterium B102]
MQPAAHSPNPYNESAAGYNETMDDNAHVMTVSRNGQVSIPAVTRTRWNARRVVVVDLGDRVVVRPLSDDPIEALQGKYRDSGQDTDHVRRQEREQERDR